MPGKKFKALAPAPDSSRAAMSPESPASSSSPAETAGVAPWSPAPASLGDAALIGSAAAGRTIADSAAAARGLFSFGGAMQETNAQRSDPRARIDPRPGYVVQGAVVE